MCDCLRFYRHIWYSSVDSYYMIISYVILYVIVIINIYFHFVQVSLLPGECDCKPISMSLSALSTLMKNNILPQTPYFFNIFITTNNLTYHLAASSESDRLKWIEAVRCLRVSHHVWYTQSVSHWLLWSRIQRWAVMSWKWIYYWFYLFLMGSL